MTIPEWKLSARQLLEDNILRFWLTEMQDSEHGGFYGRMDGHGHLHTQMNTWTGDTDTDRHWWVQCENVIGQLNLYQHFHDEAALQKVLHCYQYIQDNLVDREGGEWFWSIRASGTKNRDDDKAGFWKCPYHNGRMCLEIIEREL